MKIFRFILSVPFFLTVSAWIIIGFIAFYTKLLTGVAWWPYLEPMADAYGGVSFVNAWFFHCLGVIATAIFATPFLIWDVTD